MRCPCRTLNPTDALTEVHRWAFFCRAPGVVLADAEGAEIVFSVVIGGHAEYLKDRVVVYSVNRYGKATC